MEENNISLKFYGRDFTKIIDCLKDEVTIGESILDKEKQLRLIITFLDHQKDVIPSLVVETCNKKMKKKDNLYYLNNEQYYWSGFVGIIKGTLPQIFESDLQGKEISGENKEYNNIEITIQIQSRFDVDSTNTPSKPYFLTTMLLQCKSGVNDQLVPNNSDDFFFDLLLLYLFKDKANKCFNKGLYKTYQRFEKNDDRLKGTIDISRHIRLNMGLDNGKIAYSYRENTIDNDFNHLILYAYNKLKMKYPETVMSVYLDYNNINLRSLIDTLKSKINYNSLDSRSLISKNLRSIGHPYYTEYEDLRKISLKILRDEGVSMFSGDGEDVNGILFYVPDLWELYLEHLLKDNSKYFLHTQGYKGYPVMVIDYENSYEWKQSTLPDYVFSSIIQEKELPFMILDAKFKPAWGEVVINKSSFPELVLKDYDKCIRDMNSINAHACGVIFPTNNESILANLSNLVTHNISVFNKIDKFYTFPIIVPYSDNNNNRGYSHWIKQFKEKNLKTIELIKTNICKEKKFKIDNYKVLSALNELRKNV